MDQSSSFFQPLRIVHAAILGASLLFLGIVRFVLLDAQTIDGAVIEEDYLLYVPAAVMLAGIVLSEWLFQLRVKKAREFPELAGKLNEYRSACIIRWALLEGATFFAIVWFVLHYDRYFMAMALVGMALIAFSRPTPEKTAKNLHLNETEREIISQHGY